MEDYDIDSRNSIGDTPLAWAARNKHEGVVEILLARDDIDPNKPGEAAKRHYVLLLVTGTREW